MPDIDDEDLLRYSRHLLLPQIGVEGQERLLHSTALIVGVGGLGSPAVMYLAASGIGHLMIADYDKVDLSNLQRQLIHTTDTVGMSKTTSAELSLNKINPKITITKMEQRMDVAHLEQAVAEADVVIDATDNFETRYAINQACWQAHTPLVYSAAIRMEGQLSVFDSRHSDSPCYQCLYPSGQGLDESCSESGVLAPLTGVLGSLQALEAIKVLLEMDGTLVGRLLLLDAQRMQWREIALPKNATCPVCHG